jgi:hypothetical protein
VEGGRGAGDPGHGDGREVGQNEEELEGNRFRSLPWARVLWRGGSTAGGGAARGGGRGGTGSGNGGLEKERKLVVEVRGEVESRSSPFIGARRSVQRGYLSSRSFDGRQWRWGEISRRRPWAGELPCGAAMWDVTLRAGSRCGCGEGDRPGAGLMAEVTGWSLNELNGKVLKTRVIY